MANDRLTLVCRVCGSIHSLFKYYPGGGFIRSNLVEGADGGRIGGWIDQHIHTFDGSVPVGHVPEIMNETQLDEAWPEIKVRRERWLTGDTEPGVADRSTMNPYASDDDISVNPWSGLREIEVNE